MLSGAFQAKADLRNSRRDGRDLERLLSAVDVPASLLRQGDESGEQLPAPIMFGFEKAAVWPCAVAALVMGVAPILWLGAIDPAVQAALMPFAQVVSKVVGQ